MKTRKRAGEIARPTTIPVFYNQPQHNISRLPEELIRAWDKQKDHSPEAAQKLLRPFLRKAVIIVFDSEGLSKLSRELSLLDVLVRLHGTKEFIMNALKPYRARGMGRWAADNGQIVIFEDGDSPVDMVGIIATLQGIRAYIRTNVEKKKLIPIAMSIVRGKVYCIDDNLYGPLVNIAEHLAEEVAEAGQILAYSDTPGQVYELFATPTTIDTGLKKVFRIESGPYGAISPRFSGSGYPAPYSRVFIDVLNAYRPNEWSRHYRKNTEKGFLKEKTIVFISLRITAEEARIHATSSERGTLETLSSFMRAKRIIIKELTKRNGAEIKTPGGISIVTLPDAFTALIFARILLYRIDFLDICIACGKGPIIIHEIPNQRGKNKKDTNDKDVDGEQINLLSKLAEDRHQKNCIYFTPAIQEEAQAKWGTPISVTASGIQIDAHIYRRGEENPPPQ